MKVYIAGPVTSMGFEAARRRFAAAEALLVARGDDPVNPVEIPHPPGCLCPTPVHGSHEWACAMRKDIRRLVDCDAIWMLSGWETSHGARLELAVASAVGLRVIWE